MIKFPNIFKRKNSILTEDNQKELEQLENESFMKEARVFIVERGAHRAKMQLQVKQKKEEY